MACGESRAAVIGDFFPLARRALAAALGPLPVCPPPRGIELLVAGPALGGVWPFPR